jgi:hypothetical protein
MLNRIITKKEKKVMITVLPWRWPNTKNSIIYINNIKKNIQLYAISTYYIQKLGWPIFKIW